MHAIFFVLFTSLHNKVQQEHAAMSVCLLQGFQIVGGVLGALAALVFIPASWQR